ncbi:GNAT family N-acetyltransferase [Curtobacterium sp. MCPF17_052]|uniref:GNAT family N-acetyltransferase n=1 Tax=Curtobacterium sp. MCPF17_052 TaxID=2175655 RepID=UPI00346406C8
MLPASTSGPRRSPHVTVAPRTRRSGHERRRSSPPDASPSWSRRGADGAVRGFALVTTPGSGGGASPSDAAYLSLLAVDPSAQGSGLGRALLVAAVQEVRAAGHEHCMLHALEDNAPRPPPLPQRGVPAGGRAVPARAERPTDADLRGLTRASRTGRHDRRPVALPGDPTVPGGPTRHSTPDPRDDVVAVVPEFLAHRRLRRVRHARDRGLRTVGDRVQCQVGDPLVSERVHVQAVLGPELGAAEMRVA